VLGGRSRSKSQDFPSAFALPPCGAPSSSTRWGEVDEDCAPVDTLSAAPFAGAGAMARSISVNTGAHDSDSAPAYARREPRQSRSEARLVCLARSSCAVATSRQAAQGHPVNTGRDSRGGLLSVTFLGRARKMTSRRAAPGRLKSNGRKAVTEEAVTRDEGDRVRTGLGTKYLFPGTSDLERQGVGRRTAAVAGNRSGVDLLGRKQHNPTITPDSDRVPHQLMFTQRCPHRLLRSVDQPTMQPFLGAVFFFAGNGYFSY